jgi:hypothetical protein
VGISSAATFAQQAAAMKGRRRAGGALLSPISSCRSDGSKNMARSRHKPASAGFHGRRAQQREAEKPARQKVSLGWPYIAITSPVTGLKLNRHWNICLHRLLFWEMKALL